MSYKYLFFNFTDKPFTGYWNGKPYTFKSGVKKYYPRLIARHFAKHLTNEILSTPDEKGNTQEQYTSPKKPDEVPVFMNIFKKCFLAEEVPDEENLDIDDGNNVVEEPSLNIQTKPREAIDSYDAPASKSTGPGRTPQVIGDSDPDTGGSQDGSDEDDYADPGKTKD